MPDRMNQKTATASPRSTRNAHTGRSGAHARLPGFSDLTSIADRSPVVQNLHALQRMADGAALQRMDDEEMLQGKMLQRQADEEELLQGKLVQREIDDEEMLQGKAVQREVEDEELLQGKMIQRQGSENQTGMPDGLKQGVESLSGMSLDHVKVHRNSSKPAQVQAHAYAQGSDIHLGAGQEKHLPHEAWHVVQQAQGRVKPTTSAAGVAINDDAGLEQEADVMGQRALQTKDKSRRT